MALKITKPAIIVVGAGPSGLVLGLMLAKRGVNVQIIDAANAMDAQPRATHFAAPAVDELRRAGVLEDMMKEGFHPNGVQWRRLDGSLLGGVYSATLPEEKQIVCLPLDKVSKIVLEHVQKQPTAQVLWSHKVVNIGQDEREAWVEVETPDGLIKMSAPYIVGCDGANSQIRRSLFGNWDFPGRTWDEQIVATNCYYDMSKFPDYIDSTFVVHPEHWHMIAKIQKDGLLRITYGDIPGLTREEYIKRQPEKFKAFLPGQPTPDQYKLTNISPYKIHQRLAKKLRVGRFLLAADAAHLCNPFGGLGLTGGLVDVGNLYDCLIGIHSGLADDSILDKYDEVRREKYNAFVDPVSSENLRMLINDPDQSEDVRGFVDILTKASKDDEMSQNLQLFSLELKYDFTQHYKQ